MKTKHIFNGPYFFISFHQPFLSSGFTPLVSELMALSTGHSSFHPSYSLKCTIGYIVLHMKRVKYNPSPCKKRPCKDIKRMIFGLWVSPGKCFSFCKSVIFHIVVTFFQRPNVSAESWRHSSRIIRVIVVPVAVGIDNKEIVRVVVIRRTD